MIPDLGRYAVAVLGSYGAGIVLLAAIVGQSLAASARVRRALAETEGRAGGRVGKGRGDA